MALQDGHSVRVTKRDHPSGVDLETELERFVEPPNIFESSREMALRGDYVAFGVRPVAPQQSQIGLEHGKRFFGS